MGIIGTIASGGSIPSTPVIGTATNGTTSGVVDVAFTPSTYIGKDTITYTATASPGGATATSNNSPVSYVAGQLTSGSAYTFTIVGTTNYGVNSATTAASNSVTVENPSYWSLATLTYNTGTTAFTFSSIPQTYKHLMLVHWGLNSSSTSGGNVSLTTNGTSPSYVDYRGASYTGAAVAAAAGASAAAMVPQNVSGGTSVAGAAYVLIPNYSVSTQRGVIWSTGYDSGGSAVGVGNFTYATGGSLQQNTTNITTLTLTFSATQAANYQATLYGIKG